MSLKIYKTTNPVQFNYVVDTELVVLETYQGGTRFLSALNSFISYNNKDKTRWIFERTATQNNTTQSYLGRDGVRYKIPQPTLIYERQENGTDPIMGSTLYIYVRILLENEGNVTDDEIYVVDTMAGYKTMTLWKSQNLFTEEPTINNSDILGLKESVTGFTLNLSKLSLVLALSGEPLNTAFPRDVVLQMQLIKMHFDNRPDRMTALSADGSLDF
jgi:hypothetical protein